MGTETNQLVARIDELEDRVEELERTIKGPNQPKRRHRPLALEEFKSRFSLDTHTDRATMIGYFLDIHEDRGHFTIHDILEGYKRCRYPQPVNMSDVLGRCAGKGHLMKAGEEDGVQLWMLTETGVDYVEEMMQGGE